MPSYSLRRWENERSRALDELEGVHAYVGGTDRGRRFATQQINYAYTTMLSAHFQGFCRNLHSECADRIVEFLPAQLQLMIQTAFLMNRLLDRGNPHPGAIGDDFARFGIDFWPNVYQGDTRNRRRRAILQELIEWRNAIAHQDFIRFGQESITTLQLAKVRAWRRAVNALAHNFDRVMYNYLLQRCEAAPW